MIGQMRLSLERTFEAAHFIPKHKGACKNLHGHSYRVGVTINGLHNSIDGIFIDFGDIKHLIDEFDHSFLNDRFKIPSAENLSRYFGLKILRLNRNILEVTVSVYETENCVASSTVSSSATS